MGFGRLDDQLAEAVDLVRSAAIASSGSFALHFLTPSQTADEKSWLYQPDSGERRAFLADRLDRAAQPPATAEELAHLLVVGEGEPPRHLPARPLTPPGTACGEPRHGHAGPRDPYGTDPRRHSGRRGHHAPAHPDRRALMPSHAALLPSASVVRRAAPVLTLMASGIARPRARRSRVSAWRDLGASF